MKRFIIIAMAIFSISIIGIRISKNIDLQQNCLGYLKRAADANTVETAKEQLQKSINYLEKNNLKKGYTSVLWITPDEDIEFWYNNLKQSQIELSKVNDKTSSLEKTNLLMKLRETILDNGEKGDDLTYPDGLSRYPDNLFWGLMSWAALMFFFCILIYFSVIYDYD